METVHSKKIQGQRGIDPKHKQVLYRMQFAAKYAKSTICTLQADMVFIYTYTVKKLRDRGITPKHK